MLRLLVLLRRGRWTVGRLALELAVTERTIYRDLQVLAAVGLAVQSVRPADRDRVFWSFLSDAPCPVCLQ